MGRVGRQTLAAGLSWACLDGCPPQAPASMPRPSQPLHSCVHPPPTHPAQWRASAPPCSSWAWASSTCSSTTTRPSSRSEWLVCGVQCGGLGWRRGSWDWDLRRFLGCSLQRAQALHGAVHQVHGGFHALPCTRRALANTLQNRPPLCSVLKRYMVRYTKRGSVDGEPNLILPPLTERTIEVRQGRAAPEKGLIPSAQCLSACGVACRRSQACPRFPAGLHASCWAGACPCRQSLHVSCEPQPLCPALLCVALPCSARSARRTPPTTTS